MFANEFNFADAIVFPPPCPSAAEGTAQCPTQIDAHSKFESTKGARSVHMFQRARGLEFPTGQIQPAVGAEQTHHTGSLHIGERVASETKHVRRQRTSSEESTQPHSHFDASRIADEFFDFRSEIQYDLAPFFLFCIEIEHHRCVRPNGESESHRHSAPHGGTGSDRCGLLFPVGR